MSWYAGDELVIGIQLNEGDRRCLWRKLTMRAPRERRLPMDRLDASPTAAGADSDCFVVIASVRCSRTRWAPSVT